MHNTGSLAVLNCHDVRDQSGPPNKPSAKTNGTKTFGRSHVYEQPVNCRNTATAKVQQLVGSHLEVLATIGGRGGRGSGVVR